MKEYRNEIIIALVSIIGAILATWFFFFSIDEKKITEEVINSELLHKFGLIDSVRKPYKVLANGELKAKINIETNAISEAAKQKIEACGGTIKIL